MAANLRKTNKCYRCGAEIEPGSRYCMECGAPLKKPHGNGMIAGVAAALVIVAVFGGNAFKKNAKEAETDTDVQTESLVSDVDFEDQMTETQETEETTQKIDADISAVDSETCTLQGTLYYTSKMEDPVLIKHGNKFGVRIRATSPSIHMIRANIETEIAPIVGSEEQANDLIAYIREGEKSEEGAWETNIFGKSIGELMENGIRGKISMMDDECQMKLQDTMQKIVNDNNGGMVCIIL